MSNLAHLASRYGLTLALSCSVPSASVQEGRHAADILEYLGQLLEEAAKPNGGANPDAKHVCTLAKATAGSHRSLKQGLWQQQPHPRSVHGTGL